MNSHGGHRERSEIIMFSALSVASVANTPYSFEAHINRLLRFFVI